MGEGNMKSLNSMVFITTNGRRNSVKPMLTAEFLALADDTAVLLENMPGDHPNSETRHRYLSIVLSKEKNLDELKAFHKELIEMGGGMDSPNEFIHE